MSALNKDKHHVTSCFPPLVLLPLRHWKGTDHVYAFERKAGPGAAS